METILVAILAVLLIAFCQFRQRKPESLEACVRRIAEASQPRMEDAIRKFAEKNPDAIRKGCEVHIDVRPGDNSRLPPEYLKAFEKQEVGNGQPAAMP